MTNPHYFPTLRQDEMLYSGVGRYTDRVSVITPQRIIKSLFGEQHGRAVFGLPGHIDSLIENLPEGHHYTSDEIIDKHTPFPYYAPFLPKERVSIVKDAMKRDSAGKVVSTLGNNRTYSSGLSLTRAKYCHGCADKDRDEYGEAYWHRVHQIPHVLVCPLHRCPLIKSELVLHSRTNLYQFVSLESIYNCKDEPVIANEDLRFEFLYTIAEEANWLLQHTSFEFGPERLSYLYTTLLAGMNLTSHTRTNFVNALQLVDDFSRHYDANFLSLIGCSPRLDRKTTWLTYILKKPFAFLDPILHILLTHFLNRELKDIFSTDMQVNLFSNQQWDAITVDIDTKTSTSTPNSKTATDLSDYPIQLSLFTSEQISSASDTSFQDKQANIDKIEVEEAKYKKLIDDVKSVKNRIIETEYAHDERPKKISVLRLARELEVSTTKMYNLANPKGDIQPSAQTLSEVIKEVVESSTEYAIRKIWWAVRMCRRKKIMESKSNILYIIAGTDNHRTNPEVLKALDEAYEWLENHFHD